MNHFKTGNAYFGQGSYKNNKYNGKELQETGMYSYGWRDYMPDIARWNGIDKLAENYLSTSTYAYVANNPVSYSDVDGRWFDQDGHIIDTTGQTYGFLNSSVKPHYASNYLGVNPSDGGGGYTLTGNAASSMFKYLANGGTIDGISFANGYAKWSTGIATQTTYKDGDELFSDVDSGEMYNVKVDNKDFFTTLANNQYFSAGHLGISESTSRFGAYALRRALNPDYINFTVLSDLARPYMGTTVAGIRMSSTTAANLSKYTRYGGYALGAVAVVATELQYADGQIGDTERWANHIMTGVGLIPSPWTIGAALVYGAVTGGYQAVTGRSIFNDMGLGPKK
ncbi:RHS repeat-associated protein [Chryseobacterium ginsenosidimutans]|uniref:RHS repeat-associated protein n=2 Tax=Chryseobacterium group TaxID=2782232 RepID=A0ABU1LEB2_9FLAO|nr:RHS repeat-associated protein [Chryseobacterium geocarposphaerae]MDR6697842.1 RHS repeat-associated protein [Chryseobacterium ginsenosidimutans]